MKIKKLLGLVFLTASLGAMLSSCSSYSLLYDQVYNAAELESFHTFRIVTPEDGSLPPGMSIATYYNVAAALRQQMTERGYTEDPASDLLVNIGLTVRKELVNVPYTQTVQTGGSYLPACPHHRHTMEWYRISCTHATTMYLTIRLIHNGYRRCTAKG